MITLQWKECSHQHSEISFILTLVRNFISFWQKINWSNSRNVALKGRLSLTLAVMLKWWCWAKASFWSLIHHRWKFVYKPSFHRQLIWNKFETLLINSKLWKSTIFALSHLHIFRAEHTLPFRIANLPVKRKYYNISINGNPLLL